MPGLRWFSHPGTSEHQLGDANKTSLRLGRSLALPSGTTRHRLGDANQRAFGSAGASPSQWGTIEHQLGENNTATQHPMAYADGSPHQAGTAGHQQSLTHPEEKLRNR